MAFGDVWKESLTELSGGQRSLLALSLILAMLLFKPAPIYILDEVTSNSRQCSEGLQSTCHREKCAGCLTLGRSWIVTMHSQLASRMGMRVAATV